ncbi:MAG: TonB-dependent receptor [Bacteroidia bacterium]|nr:TonB-dependent receptor [Bacteroidia bacterium]
MKLTLFLSMMTIFQLWANESYSQLTKLTLKLEDVTISDALKEIENQSEFFFLYSPKLIDVERRINIDTENETIKDILAGIFDKKVKFSVYDRQVILTPIEQSGLLSAFQQQLKITGTVTDEKGSPLPGVTVLVKGTTLGVLTDASGKYTISNAPENATLIFSFVGMASQEIPSEGRMKIDVVLKEVSLELDEVVVIGYGTVKKRDITGSVTSVSSKDFVKGVYTNALQLLSGKASGVSVTQTSSEPGGTLNIRIRGAGSINSSNSILVVIDGLPGGDPANLNPSDIENIEILKDASAAAIYGTRAANGVLLITTKMGKEGTPQVSYSTNFAYQTPSYKIDVLNATQYMLMINDISKDAGKTIPYTTEQIAAAGKGTDWQDELFRNAWAQNHQFSITGGNKQLKYYTSLGYLDQNGIMVSSGIKKYNALVNIETNPSEKFKFGIKVNINSNMKDKIPNESNRSNEYGDPLNAALGFDPRLSPKKNENGEYERNPSVSLGNPVSLAYGYDYREQNNRIFGSAFGEYQIANGLKGTFRFGTDINNVRNDEYSDRTTVLGKANGGIGNVYSTNLNYWLAEGLVNYDKTFRQHHISFIGGATWEKFDNIYLRSYTTGFLSDVTNTNLLQSGNVLSNQVYTSKIVYKLQSFIGRINYTFLDKYLLTASIRRDGTSRFSDKNKYAVFPSIAVGWRITEEPFMKNISVISNLKLKFGYGQTGNEGIDNFETRSTFVAGGNAVLGGVQQSGAQPARIPNPELTWETTEEYNFGLDFGLFDNRISGEIEYYFKNSIDQLFSKPVPMSSGFSNIRTNFGTVRNSGIDLSITSHNLTGKFQWNTNITVSTLKNEIVELPPYVGDIIIGGIVDNIPGFALVRQGYPMSAFYGYKVTGIFQIGDDIAKSAQPTAKPGEPIFLDYDNNGKIDGNDRVILGDPFPDLSYSINNTFSYKNFNLDIYLLGVQGIETFNGNVLESMFPINFDRNIMTKHYINRWTPENPNTGYPSGVNSAIYFGGGKMINSYTIQDASFVRLKNVTLSYNIPMKNFKLFKSILVTLSGENLLTITKFDGYDPEANQSGNNVEKSSFNNYPIARVFRIGANINF